MTSVELESKRKLGADHYSQGRFAEAEAVFREVTDALPTHADSWKFLGFCHQAQHRPSDAAGCMEKAIALGANDAETFYGLGLARAAASEHERAVEALDEALSRHPNHVHAREAICRSLFELANAHFANNDDD